MPAYRLPSPLERPPLHRRASGLGLALGVNLLIILALLGVSRFTPTFRKSSPPIIIDLIAGTPDPAASSAAEDQPRDRPVDAATPPVKPPPIVLPVPPTIAPPPPPADRPLPWIEMSRADMAAGDLRALPKPTPGAGDSEEVGRGPRGEVLYAADWARLPTNAELSGYMPRNVVEGWGLIACRTAPGNRVEDCVEIDQSPRGSRLASAVRQAAWQFRVKPPRKNGRPMVGEWVRIRIEYEVTRG